MKIQTTVPQNFGQSVLFHDLTVKFDRLGVAEVKPGDAEWMMSCYPGWITPYEADKKAEVKVDLKGVEKELEDTKKAHQFALDAKASEVISLEAELAEWKTKNGELVLSEAKAVKELEDLKTYSAKRIDELEFNILLLGTDVKGLLEICSNLKLEPAKYSDKKKPELITLILDESRGK